MSSCCPGNNVSRPSTTVEMGFLSYKELPLLLWSLISSQCCNQLLALRGATSADSTRCRLKRSATADTRNMHIHTHGLHTHTHVHWIAFQMDYMFHILELLILNISTKRLLLFSYKSSMVGLNYQKSNHHRSWFICFGLINISATDQNILSMTAVPFQIRGCRLGNSCCFIIMQKPADQVYCPWIPVLHTLCNTCCPLFQNSEKLEV